MIDKYSPSNAEVLTLPEAVRKRPGMYFGNINSLAVNTAIYEAVSNVVDQYLAGNATTLKVHVNGDIIRVIDDGPGLPFDRPAPSDCANLAEHYFIHRHDLPTADNHAPHVHIIGGGLGLAILNAASDQLIVKSSNGVKVYRQVYRKGKIISPCQIENIESPSGTELEIRLDAELFQKHMPDLSAMRTTLFELAHFYPGLVVEFQEERFVTSCGLLDLAYIQYSHFPVPQETSVKYFFEQVKNDIHIQVAALGDSETDTVYKSWVNGVATIEGGTHVTGLGRAFQNVNWKPRLALIHLIMRDPQFAGPSKDILRSFEVESAIEEMVTESLIEFHKNMI